MTQRVPLSDAAIRLGLTYHQVRELVFRRDLVGGRDGYGRFYVEATSIEDYARRRSASDRNSSTGGTP